jgi:signal transduction histidine kinase
VLDDFIVANRAAIVALTRARVASRRSPRPSDVELSNGIPLFLDQLTDALRLAKAKGTANHAQIRASAGRHGHDLLGTGLTIAQVVHDYGDVCQAVTELAMQQGAAIAPDEFQTLNLCLDDAIAEAVTEYARFRESAIEDHGTERLGVLAHEMRNLLSTATLSFEAIKSGHVPPGGSTGLLHSRCLLGLSVLIDRSLADVRLDAGVARSERISVAALLEDVEIAASMEARARGMELVVGSLDRAVTIEGDRQILVAAISNLLQNAFKFTRKAGTVSLTARATNDRVFLEIADECGGLPPGKINDLFRPFEQRSGDRSGVGLGLSICLKAATANDGEIHVRDLPGHGCVFTLELPRKPPATATSSTPA